MTFLLFLLITKLWENGSYFRKKRDAVKILKQILCLLNFGAWMK